MGGIEMAEESASAKAVAASGRAISEYKRFLSLILIMAGVSLVVGAITITVLYRAALHESRERLVETAQSQARLIEAVARFDRKRNKDYPEGWESATLSQITDAHERYKGFGETGEFTLGRRDGENIVFLLSHRHYDLENPKPVPFQSELAEPMRRALLGQQGTVIGLDYRGSNVLAAHEPVAELGLGIVAKIDLAEVRAPFIRAGLFAAGSAFFVILLGSGLFIGISSPILGRLRVLYEKSQQELADRKRAQAALREERNRAQRFLDVAGVMIVVLREDQTVDLVNRKGCEILGFSEEEIVGENWFEHFVPVPERQQVKDAFAMLITGKVEPIEYFENQVLTSTGETRIIEWYNTVLRDEAGRIIGTLSSGTNVTDRKRAERALRLSHRVLEIVNRHTEMDPLLEEFVGEVKDFSGCAAVGIRILDKKGNIPYQAYAGFSREFYELESPLSIETDQCMCISIIRGELDPELPCVTAGGSFSVGGTTRFLALTPEETKGLSRNACNRFGYESVGLVPIWHGDQIRGLIHVADPRENAIPAEVLEALEKVAMQLGEAIQRVRVEEALREAHDELERRVEERTAELTEANEQLKHEILERSRAEEALRESQSRLIHAQHVARMGFWDWSITTNDLYWSEEIYRIFGLSRDQFGATYDEFIARVHPDDRDLLQEHVDAAVHQNAEYSVDHRIVLPSGDVQHVHELGEVYRDGEGKPVRMIGTVIDITDRKRAEEALRKTKQRLELAVRGTSDGLWDWNVVTNDVWFAPRFKELLGYKDHELAHTFANWESRLHPEDRGRILEAVRLHLEQRRPYEVEARVRVKSGEYRWFRARGEAVRDEAGKAVRMAGSIEDINDRKELENELSRISTFEQQRIGQELHDGVGQELLGVGLMAKALHKSLDQKGLPDAEAASKLAEAMQSAQRSVRALIEGMRPVEVDADGLTAALSELAESAEALADIRCSLACDEPVTVKDDHVAEQLFRIAQEAVRNAVKHSKARHIAIRMKADNRQITLSVRDDGRGVQGEPGQTKGMGLRIMRYRAGIIGAALEVRPADGGGTLVACTYLQDQHHDQP
jgi:PAS domain S-box-containing protein